MHGMKSQFGKHFPSVAPPPAPVLMVDWDGAKGCFLPDAPPVRQHDGVSLAYHFTVTRELLEARREALSQP